MGCPENCDIMSKSGVGVRRAKVVSGELRYYHVQSGVVVEEVSRELRYYHVQSGGAQGIRRTNGASSNSNSSKSSSPPDQGAVAAARSAPAGARLAAGPCVTKDCGGSAGVRALAASSNAPLWPPSPPPTLEGTPTHTCEK